MMGELDHPSVRDCGESIAERIPGCRKVVVPGVDHLLPLRVPELLADIISDYAHL
jgi:pimeloyl-ACP methyl ester carboxylesterase